MNNSEVFSLTFNKRKLANRSTTDTINLVVTNCAMERAKVKIIVPKEMDAEKGGTKKVEPRWWLNRYTD